MYVGIDLATAPLDTALTLVEAQVSERSRAGLLSRGLRVGTQFRLVSRTAGGGRVILVAGSRVALGKELLGQLRAEVAH